MKIKWQYGTILYLRCAKFQTISHLITQLLYNKLCARYISVTRGMLFYVILALSDRVTLNADDSSNIYMSTNIAIVNSFKMIYTIVVSIRIYFRSTS
jgi:hypothetical protein